MTKYLIAFVCAAIVFGALDAMWLRWAGDNLYRPVIGSIMAENFMRSVKSFVEEGTELFGYTLLLIAAIEYFRESKS